jgi:sodium transport system ATP-binding protein
MPGMDTRIEADRLTRVWPVPNGEPVRAVWELSLSVGAGEVYGLLGANGAGKSTTMRMLATLTKPTSGTARVGGFDVQTHPAEVRARLGYLSASSGLPTRVSCREVLDLFANLHHVDDVTGAVARAIDTFGIADFAERRIETLSTGMRQRVRIAAAAVHDPPVLILDEPTAGLDLVASDRLLDSILAARDKGTSVVFSTHILREAARICDRIGVIDEGRLIAEGTPEALQLQTGTDSLDAAFLALVTSG